MKSNDLIFLDGKNIHYHEVVWFQILLVLLIFHLMINWNGKQHKKRKNNIFTSLDLDQERHERHNIHLQKKYAEIKENEVLYEEIMTEDAEYIVIAFGSAARIAQKSIEDFRKEGIKVGLFRPITLWPFPTKQIARLAEKTKGMLSMEINAGQMVQDIRLAVEGKTPVYHYGRMGGMVPTPEEISDAIKNLLIKE